MSDPNINITGGDFQINGDMIGGDKIVHVHPPAPPREFVAPFQALADLQTFVGRAEPLKILAGMGALGVTNPRFLIAGSGGLGKTTLAIHIAHQLKHVFDGGVLWADLETDELFNKLDEWAGVYLTPLSRPQIEKNKVDQNEVFLTHFSRARRAR